jgi:hypothetical protein
VDAVDFHTGRTVVSVKVRKGAKHRSSLNKNGGGQGGGGDQTTEGEKGTVEGQDWTNVAVWITKMVADGVGETTRPRNKHRRGL